MKRIASLTALAMVVALALALVGCGSSNSQSEIEVKDFNAVYYRGLVKENVAKASAEFEGKTYKVEGLKVIEISKDNVRVSNNKTGAEYPGIYRVFLPTETIATLKKDQEITFIGTLKNPTDSAFYLADFKDAHLA